MFTTSRIRTMIHLLLPLSVAVEGITLLAAASAGIHLTPGLYVGKATEVTKACWPGMARIHLLFEPPTVAGRASTLSITQENGRNHYIASGKALAYPTSVFMTDWGSGTGFFINSTHIYPGRKRKPLPLPARIPFYTEDGNLTAFLDAREDENGRVYHVNCPVHLNKITSFISISPVRPKASAETKNGDMVEEVSSRDQKPVVGASRAAAKTQEKAVVDGVVMDDKREIGSGSGSASETGGRDMVNGERQVASGFDAASKEGELVVENVMMLEERGPTSGSSSASEVDAGEVVEDAVVQENAVARGSSPGCPTLEPSPAAARLYSQTRLIPFVKQGATGLARVVVEGAIIVLGKLVTLCGPVYLTCESNSDASFFRLPPLYPSQIRGLQPLGCYYLQGQSEEDITAALAVAEMIIQISPLRMDNIYICINSGMWRIHLGEETVDGLGREVVLPLVDVDDPFDPFD